MSGKPTHVRLDADTRNRVAVLRDQMEHATGVNVRVADVLRSVISEGLLQLEVRFAKPRAAEERAP